MAIPAPKRGNTRAAPPTREDAATGFDATKKAADGRKAQLNMPIDFELKRAFKEFAASRDMKQNELFEACFNYYKANH
jgi:hypothetical protein